MNNFHPRLIAVDIDGTLLNSARQITQETQAAISFARQQAVKVLPCSGRHFSGTRAIAHQAGMDGLLVCGNGALVATDHGEVIAAHMLSPDRCLELLRFCDFYHLGSNLYADDVLYTCRENSVTRYYAMLNQRLPPPEQCRWQVVRELSAEVARHHEGILKLEIFPLPEEPGASLQALLRSWHDVEAEGNLRTSVELHASGVSKATGLAAAAKYSGISLSEVLAIGDAENDIPMLKAAGRGAAMGNAGAAARAAADEVIPSCDDDGVAWVIRHYVAEKERPHEKTADHLRSGI